MGEKIMKEIFLLRKKLFAKTAILGGKTTTVETEIWPLKKKIECPEQIFGKKMWVRK